MEPLLVFVQKIFQNKKNFSDETWTQQNYGDITLLSNSVLFILPYFQFESLSSHFISIQIQTYCVEEYSASVVNLLHINSSGSRVPFP